MKINEIITNINQVQPSLVKQQASVNKVVNQIAASDEKQQPTEIDKVIAMRAYSDMKKRTNKHYAERLRKQLAQAEWVAKNA
jgi:uncharacterized protein YoxC